MIEREPALRVGKIKEVIGRKAFNMPGWKLFPHLGSGFKLRPIESKSSREKGKQDKVILYIGAKEGK